MTTPLSPVISSRLEKASVDNGFDKELPPLPGEEGDWLTFEGARRVLGVDQPLRVRGLAKTGSSPIRSIACVDIVVEVRPASWITRGVTTHGPYPGRRLRLDAARLSRYTSI